MIKDFLLFLFLILTCSLRAEDGYRLWLRYDIIENKGLLNQYRNNISGLQIERNTPTLLAAADELTTGLEGLLGKRVPSQKEISDGTVIAGTPRSSAIVAGLPIRRQLQ